MERFVEQTDTALAEAEIYEFLNEGLQDVQNNELLDFNEVFDELEIRYGVND